jgi:hypothetical protein
MSGQRCQYYVIEYLFVLNTYTEEKDTETSSSINHQDQSIACKVAINVEFIFHYYYCS